MKPTAQEAGASELRGFVPSPWYVLYEFARQIGVGSWMTFGPLPANERKQADRLKSRALNEEFIHGSNSRRINGQTA